MSLSDRIVYGPNTYWTRFRDDDPARWTQLLLTLGFACSISDTSDHSALVLLPPCDLTSGLVCVPRIHFFSSSFLYGGQSKGPLHGEFRWEFN